MEFSKWLNNRINESKKAQPVQMPKERTDKVELSDPSPQRIAGGRKNTSFKSKKNKGTRCEKNKEAIKEY